METSNIPSLPVRTPRSTEEAHGSYPSDVVLLKNNKKKKDFGCVFITTKVAQKTQIVTKKKTEKKTTTLKCVGFLFKKKSSYERVKRVTVYALHTIQWNRRQIEFVLYENFGKYNFSVTVIETQPSRKDSKSK